MSILTGLCVGRQIGANQACVLGPSSIARLHFRCRDSAVVGAQITINYNIDLLAVKRAPRARLGVVKRARGLGAYRLRVQIYVDSRKWDVEVSACRISGLLSC